MQKENQLLIEIQNAIKQSIPDKKIGIAFSGGVDSTLISKICSELGYDITLLTIGFSNSHDILFAKEVNKFLHYIHKISEIDQNTFDETVSKINKKINTDNLSWNENCIAFYYVARLANNLGIKTVVTANGIDELFCGYNAYREAMNEGENKVQELMNSKLENEHKMMQAVNDVTSEFSVKILQPLLSEKFIQYAKTIPISEKIKGKDDLLRKHIIRKLASELGIPEISTTKRKKALQYGSLIHKALLKSR
ncbi:MAG TPA: asparagine synthase C-terminal domain-containing protein [Nitrosopumilaceae archaeon]|nr:asparagine synthase C-terminal domain-containing protein [Nitrosopumilaceae archaeon]